MDDPRKGRENQKHRTRQALIDAAIPIAQSGRPLVITEVAAAALVSTATAYRYFPNPQSLWVEVGPRALQVPRVDELTDLASDDPFERLTYAIEKISRFQFDDEPLWRAVLHATLERWLMQVNVPEEQRAPVRGETRAKVTRWSLEPLKERLPAALLERLTHALMLVYGLEAMIVTRDACGLDREEATAVMKWAAHALVRSALAEAEAALAESK
ncbi:hypothetical protein LVJ94_23595 [Pendulispora rubella]|uniref:TetR family transcriptional regulator n=1 Tax=Pendulispora rubella TaxID=2741070 RepID=A0ABZ2LKT9_9BACT